jgi:hypothetical protein
MTAAAFRPEARHSFRGRSILPQDRGRQQRPRTHFKTLTPCVPLSHFVGEGDTKADQGGHPLEPPPEENSLLDSPLQ